MPASTSDAAARFSSVDEIFSERITLIGCSLLTYEMGADAPRDDSIRAADISIRAADIGRMAANMRPLSARCARKHGVRGVALLCLKLDRLSPHQGIASAAQNDVGLEADEDLTH